MASGELQDAVIRNVEGIGEAAKRVSAASRDRMALFDCKSICGMRDVRIPDSIGIDLEQPDYRVARVELLSDAEAARIAVGS